MRKVLQRLCAAGIALALVASCSSSSDTPAPEPIQRESVEFVVPEGDLPTAPTFRLAATDGSTVDTDVLWEYGPTVVVFFTTWCSVCIARQGEFSALAERYRNVASFVGVVQDDSTEDIQYYLRDHPVSYPVIRDPEVSLWKSYAANEPPFVAVISKDGLLVKGWPGGRDAAEVEVELDKLLGLSSP